MKPPVKKQTNCLINSMIHSQIAVIVVTKDHGNKIMFKSIQSSPIEHLFIDIYNETVIRTWKSQEIDLYCKNLLLNHLLK
ncbi:CLUMA_CG006100, isoform A [Clunio marinus]|uniref:CLUMA_CG006100, isoform A n=1 Tax=Clunio marinus TaxID=568069 RepID=A0A1J1HWV3_9DIPT|nr:CLUMA_CG006100, isoform A [Clunio marinus]